MQRLGPDDLVMLLGDDAWPQEIAALAILDGADLVDPAGRPRTEAVRAAVENKLHLLPRFRQRLLRPPRGLGDPLWVDAIDFDVDQHVHAVAVEPPGGDHQLLGSVEQLLRRRLDPERPLWDLCLLFGLADDRVALLVRLHHVMADGMAGLATLATLLDPDAELDMGTAGPPAWNPAPAPSTRDLALDNLSRHLARFARAVDVLLHPARTARRLAAVVPTVRWMLTAQPGPATSLDQTVGRDRKLALVRCDLAAMRAAAHRHDATVNDVLLAAVAGGVRTLLDHRRERVTGLAVPIYVPVSLRPRPSSREGGNRVSQMVVPLPVDEADPVARLARISVEAARRKAGQHPSVGMLLPTGMLGRMILATIARRRVNLTSADLVGPAVPLHAAGAAVREVFPVVPLIGNVTLGVGALSYAGRFAITVVADAHAHPDLVVFTAALEHALADLGVPAGEPVVS